MNISGVIVHAHPGRVRAVRAALAALPGVEIHGATDDGRLIVTVEDRNGADPGDTMLSLHRIDGVLAAAMVYHHFESDSATQETTQEIRDETDQA